ncbi:FeoB-associated Cys-rich membrane protein [Parabacteroides sp. TM07-1AC]|nr:FeoB-associated Cys-rich membrane protein [Parabacteroides sp. TM07-1AC]
MWQNIAIGIIALLTIIYIGRKIYNLFTRSKHAPSACQGCCGCSLSKEKNKTCV